MSAVIQTNKGVRCGICYKEFSSGEQKFSHVGGEGHDGFHKLCLANWLDINQICPFDRQRIDPSTIRISRTVRVMDRRLKAALVDAAYAIFIGAIAAGAEGIAARAAGVETQPARAVGLALATGVGILERAVEKPHLRAMTEAGVPQNLIVALIATLRLFALGVAFAFGEGVEAAAAGVCGFEIEDILMRMGVHITSRENIGIGLMFGGQIIRRAIDHVPFTELTALLTMVLIAGIIAGVIKLKRE